MFTKLALHLPGWIAGLASICFLPTAMCQTPLDGYELLSQDDWPWWRGPTRNGIANPDCQPPTSFGPSENIKWKTPIAGRGHSSPIVVAGRIFLTSADEQQQSQSVLAFDLATGQQLWQQEISRGGFPKQNHPKNSEASSTIASDGESLFATFFHDKQVHLTALSLQGQKQWEKSVNAFNPKKYEYGYAPSPLIHQNSVIVSAEWDGDSNILAFEQRSGSPLWKRERLNNITFSSPVVATVAGREQLLISGSNKVSSYNPSDGSPLWDVDGTTAATCGTMIWNKDLVFASGGYPESETIAVAADGSGRVAWRNKQQCYEQSMILVDENIYALSDGGILHCWRASDGMETWRQRLGGPVSASPVYAGGNIYWANESGTMFVFRANPSKFELVAQNQIGSEAFASPAVVGNQLILRIAERTDRGRQEYLVCVGQ